MYVGPGAGVPPVGVAVADPFDPRQLAEVVAVETSSLVGCEIVSVALFVHPLVSITG